jgi:hypothetical protein
LVPADSAVFTIDQRSGHWWLITPEGEPFFSLGMNHIDSATLRTPECLPLWRERYGNDQRRWLEERVAPDLVDWGFNTVGWTQEVVIRGQAIHRHSRRFTYEEYQWLGLPYCHMLPFAEIHQWELETRYPDVFSSDFEDWCDYVARDDCARMADDPKLVGYFYSDCPTWVHPQVKPCDKGPWFEPVRLESAAGRQKLFEMASRYYRVTHDAIRRYDPHHLILGDRYEAKARLPDEVLQAAAPFVDVLSFQYFASESEIAPDFLRWHGLTGLPVLLADACAPEREPARYEPMLRALRELPCCVGWHLCGAYLRNRTREHGLRNEDESPNQPLIDAVQQANLDTQTWVRASAKDDGG